MNTIEKVGRKITKLYKQKGKSWKEPFKKVEIPSNMDGTNQKAYYYKSPYEKKVPLIVSLHSWAGDYAQLDNELSKFAVESEFNYIHPDFRGINNTQQACGSELSMSDINDSIQYAIDHGNVDLENIFVVGGSGGAYSALCFYSATQYPINSYIVWSPITDLISWHDQSIIRKSRYWKDILNGTNSKESLDIEEARKRSPLYRYMPESDSKLFIFSGYHDGYNDAPVPVTHSLNFYNKYVDRFNGNESDYISERDIILLTAREMQETDETIERKKVFYSRKFQNAQITIFDGGHDHLYNHSIKLINENIK